VLFNHRVFNGVPHNDKLKQPLTKRLFELIEVS
jgi:hypothetical protein